jgi:predicted permease
MNGWLQDFRYAWRQLGKSPAFTLTVVVTLALGIAANSTIFSWINATLLDPIPGAVRTRELVSLMRGERNDSPVPPFSYSDYADLRAQNQSFSGLMAYQDNPVSLTGNGKAERVFGADVSANFFEVLGARPILGRAFLPQEEQSQGSAAVIVISHGLWQSHFGADRSVIGRTLEINRHPFIIVGVAPPAFIGPKTALKCDIWAPLTGENDRILFGATKRMEGRGWYFLQLLGRLKPGVPMATAEREIDVLMQQIAQQYPNEHRGLNTISFDPLWRSPFGANVYLAKTLPILLAIAAVVLLLACANVANLLLVRSLARRREIAVRLAIGANRWRLVRELLVESLLLSLASGAMAALLTTWTARTMVDFIPTTIIPVALNGRVDANVLLATLLISLLASVVFGILPALRTSKLAPVTVLKEDAGSGGLHKGRLARGLVVAQIALSFLLLICAGLFVRALNNAEHADPGFDAQNMLLANYDLLPAGYDRQSGIEFHRQLIAKLETIPGVESATLSDWVPLAFNKRTESFTPEGYDPQPHETLETRRAVVGPNYFRTMRLPLVAGRDFTFQDTGASQPVAVVSEAFARRYWPQQDALGKRLRTRGQWFTVVGLARDSKHFSLNEPPEPIFYLPLLQDYRPDVIIQVRTSGDPQVLLPQVEQAVHELNANLPVFAATSMKNSMRLSTLFERVAGSFVGASGLLALLLASVGLYGVVAYSTRQRTREIGIRMALGAGRGDVFRLVLSEGLRLVAAGLMIGLALALAFTRLLQSMLLGIGATDGLTFCSVAFILTMVAIVACCLPARRAMRVEPMVALRYE